MTWDDGVSERDNQRTASRITSGGNRYPAKAADSERRRRITTACSLQRTRSVNATVPTPPGAPKANAFAERWVRSVRHELLDRTLIWNQRQLRRLLDEYIAHYNAHRPHQGISQRAPDDTEPAELAEVGRPVTRTPVCGGLINQYRHAA